jgi:hypothetical protein
MDLAGINGSILRHQPTQLDERAVEEALSAAAAARDESPEGRRLAAACALTDRWPMAVCEEVARALLTPRA